MCRSELVCESQFSLSSISADAGHHVVARGERPSSLRAKDGAHHHEYAHLRAQEVPPIPLDTNYCRDTPAGSGGSGGIDLMATGSAPAHWSGVQTVAIGI